MARKDGIFYLWKYILCHFVFTAISMVSIDTFFSVSECEKLNHILIKIGTRKPKCLFQYQYYQNHFGHRSSSLSISTYLSVWKIRDRSSLDLWFLSVWRVSLLIIGICYRLEMCRSEIWEGRERRTSCKGRTSAQSRKWLKLLLF